VRPRINPGACEKADCVQAIRNELDLFLDTAVALAAEVRVNSDVFHLCAPMKPRFRIGELYGKPEVRFALEPIF
jgi:hypothetical protein